MLSMDMLIYFPCLIPMNTQATVYEGFIEICDEEFHVHIELPPTKRLKELTLSCDWKLQQYLIGYEEILKQSLLHCSSLSEYLSEVKSLVERKIEEKQKTHRSTTSRICGQLISEIEALGWDRLVSIDADFQTLELQHRDSENRQHVLKIRLHPEHPRQAPQCIVDLPGKADFQWNPASSLESLYTQFTQMVDVYQDVFNVMEELDKNTWILEPEKPVYSALYRRLAIGTNASLQITVDPRHPRMLPEYQFLGADQVVNPLKYSMNSNLHIWNTNKGLLENFQCLLGITFPSPSTSKKEEYSVECGICYSYRLETELPDETCSDQRCGQTFHQTCLYEWLRALPSSRQSFNTIFGECPYCEKPITVKMTMK